MSRFFENFSDPLHLSTFEVWRDSVTNRSKNLSCYSQLKITNVFHVLPLINLIISTKKNLSDHLTVIDILRSKKVNIFQLFTILRRIELTFCGFMDNLITFPSSIVLHGNQKYSNINIIVIPFLALSGLFFFTLIWSMKYKYRIKCNKLKLFRNCI